MVPCRSRCRWLGVLSLAEGCPLMLTRLRSVLLMWVRALRAAAAAAAHMQAACRQSRKVTSACKIMHKDNKGWVSRQAEALLLTLEPWCTTCCMGTKGPLVVRGLPYVPPESCCAKWLLRRRLMLLECSGLTLAVSPGCKACTECCWTCLRVTVG